MEGPTIPDYDVFISYSSADKQVADAVCAALEAKRWRCWIAPRDIVAGSDWGGAIIEAIEQSRVMVLVYSSRANQSQQVVREVERAVSKGLPIIPFRLEAVPLSKSMEYFLSASHWLDAMSEPLESHLAQLCRVIRTLLTPVPETGGAPPRTIGLPGAATGTARTQPGEAAVAPARRRREMRWLLPAGALALVAVVVAAIALGRGSWWHKDGSAQLRPSAQMLPASRPTTQLAAGAGTTAPAGITQRTVLLHKTGFILKPGRRIEHYEITIPPLATPTATLQILVENMGDDSGDMGMYCILLDAKGTTVFRQFGRTDRLFTHEVGPLTSWTVVLQDQDTGRGGNGGAIEIAVAPR